MEYARKETKKVENRGKYAKVETMKKIYENHGKLQRYADT